MSKAKAAARKPQKFSRKGSGGAAVEDLDLDVGGYFSTHDDAAPLVANYDEGEEKVIFNKRDGRVGTKAILSASGVPSDDEDDGVHAVLPNDAHRGVHAHEEADGAVEEAEMALRKARHQRKALADGDFALLDGIAPAAAATTSHRSAPAKGGASALAATLETVQRDLGALTAPERQALIERDAPEVARLLEEYKGHLAEISRLSKPLHELVHKKKVTTTDERNLLAFLETKVQLLLSYCMHVSFYLLLKAEGQSVAGHPVIDRLVELRVYIEKLWPLEQKLQYSLNKLLTPGPTAKGQQVRLGDIRAVAVEEGGAYKPSGAKLADDAGYLRRQALRQKAEAEELAAAEEEAMTRVQRKKGKGLADAGAYLEHAADDGYREDEDQFFSRVVGGGSDSDGEDTDAHLSLIERLRAHATKKQGKAKAAAAATKRSREKEEQEQAVDDDGEEGDSDGEEGDDDHSEDINDGDDAYRSLVAENQAMDDRRAAAKEAKEAAAGKTKRPPVDRRKISKHITTHRGLTKTRPKDRKTPRTAQRHKYDKASAKARTQSKTYKPEPEGGFQGVAGFRANVTHSTKLS